MASEQGTSEQNLCEQNMSAMACRTSPYTRVMVRKKKLEALRRLKPLRSITVMYDFSLSRHTHPTPRGQQTVLCLASYGPDPSPTLPSWYMTHYLDKAAFPPKPALSKQKSSKQNLLIF